MALAAGAELVAWDQRFVDEVARLASADAPVRLHVKLDSGMGRLGTRDADAALAVARADRRNPAPALDLAGAMTHFATADDDPEFMRQQLEAFSEFVARLRARSPRLTVHAANSAATLRGAETHFEMVRCGIAIYGCDPMNEDPAAHQLEPALELRSYVAAVKLARPGRQRRLRPPLHRRARDLDRHAADRLRRRGPPSADQQLRRADRRAPLPAGGDRQHGQRHRGRSDRILGVAVGDEATLIGRDGAERQTAEDLAARIETINYEILTGIPRRVPRIYHRDGRPA